MAKILVGLSGGVDSAVVVALLKSQGHEVQGYTLKLLETTSEESEGCCTFKDIRDASIVCDKMGIDFLVTNWKKQFRKNVIDQYIEGAKNGIAYNPCVTCNSTIKLPVLAAVANHFHCDYIATGHYARIQNGRIARAKNLKKDQSYFLWQLPKSIISKLMFPLGEIDSKDDTREMAREFGLHVANKKDSTDLCFLGGGTKDDFLKNNGIVPINGNFVEKDGTVLGKHNGHTSYVAGQRAGIGGTGKPRFVLDVLPNGDVLVGGKEDTKTLNLSLRDGKIDDDIDWNKLTAVIRYHSEPVPVESLSVNGSDIQVTLKNPVMGAAKGQSCVFYYGDEVVGGGIIC